MSKEQQRHVRDVNDFLIFVKDPSLLEMKKHFKKRNDKFFEILE
jgi:hypothetical protein